jgi:hypothetical protein
MLGQTHPEAVKYALHYWDNCGQEEYLQNLNFIEQRVLIEALLWSFVYYTLKPFMETYEVLWVEQEVIQSINYNKNAARFIPGKPIFDLVFDLVRMSRPDVIVRDRESREIVVISWKTIDLITNWRKLFYRHDLQGMLESAFSELFFEQRKKDIYRLLRETPPTDELMAEHINRVKESIKDFDALPDKVDYVQTIFLQKGKRKKVSSSSGDSEEDTGGFGGYDENYFSDFDETYENSWTQDSFLLYPYVRRDSPDLENKVPGKPLLSWKWRYQRPGLVSFNTLGKSYKRELIALLNEPYSQTGSGRETTSKWIEALNEKAVFPSDLMPALDNPLSQVIVWDEPQYRNQKLQKSLVEQTGRHELRRAEAAIQLQQSLDSGIPFEQALDQITEFEQRLTRCQHPWKCEFQGICFNESPEFDYWSQLPKGYALRVPHHVPEAEYFEELQHES